MLDEDQQFLVDAGELIRLQAVALAASEKRVKVLEAIAGRVYEELSWVSILEHAKEGMEEWASKPANRKWWRRIDGTPTPNDLMICVSKAIGEAFRPLHDAAERIVNPKAAALAARTQEPDDVHEAVYRVPRDCISDCLPGSCVCESEEETPHAD